MNRMMVRAAALISAFVAASPASAAITFTLSNVTFATAAGAPAGTLTGSFTTNDARTAITTYNLVASASGSFLGFTYTPATSTVTASVLPSQYFQLDSAGSTNELRLYFTSGLSASGGTISPTFSYESEPGGGTRFPTGTVVAQASAAVPEVATWAMMMLGFGALGFTMRRQTKVSTRIRFA